MDCMDVLESGNVSWIDGMINSVSCKKSRNRDNKEIVKECEEILEKCKEWKEKNGMVKSSKRGKYDEVKDIKSLSDNELDGMYESLYSRRCYYRDNNKKKYDEICKRIEEIKKERLERKIERMKKEMMK